ncbi:rRNA maturation RNase YbeY [Chloroflexota bacterium]
MEIDVLIDDGVAGCPETGWLQNIAWQVLIAQCVDSEVEMSLVITGQERVRQLNRDYRGKDEPTDVLAFSMTSGEGAGADLTSFIAPPDGVSHLGEVIISCPQAVEQAKEHGHSIKREMAILIIHGVLHLLGYDHEKPGQERQMQAMEREILGNIEGYLD